MKDNCVCDFGGEGGYLGRLIIGILWYFLSSVVADDKDGSGLKLEKISQLFQVLLLYV